MKKLDKKTVQDLEARYDRALRVRTGKEKEKALKGAIGVDLDGLPPHVRHKWNLAVEDRINNAILGPD